MQINTSHLKQQYNNFNEPMIIKIAFQKQIHLYRGQMQLGKIKKHCQNVFRTLPKSFQFYCLDNDGDQISLNSQQDLDIIFQEQQRTSFKKIFIHQVDNEFQILNEIANPEEISDNKNCKLQLNDIKIINLVKQKMQRQKQEMIVYQTTNKFLFELEKNIIQKAIKQVAEEQKIIKLETDKFLCEVENNLIQKLVEEENKLVNEQVSHYMDYMIKDCSTKMAQKLIYDEQKESQEKKKQNDKISKDNQRLIDRLVDEKINKMLPMLIKQISRTVQSRLMHESCFKCNKKNAELQLERMISLSLLKKSQMYNDI